MQKIELKYDKIYTMKIIKQFYKQFLILIILIVISNSAVQYFFELQRENYLTLQTKLFKEKYKTQYGYYKIMSTDIYTMYQDNKTLIELYAKIQKVPEAKGKQIKEKIYKLLSKRFKRLKNMGVEDIQFHGLDGKVFLSMNDPHSDLCTECADSQHANLQKKPRESRDTFDVAGISHSFRYIYTFHDNKERFLGTVEIVFLSEQVLDSISSTYLVDKHFIILKTILEARNSTEDLYDYYKESFESKKHMISIYDHHNNEKQIDALLTPKLKDIISRKMLLNKAFSVSGIYNFNALSITFLPIQNKAYKENFAWLVFYSDSDHIDSLIIEKHYTKLLFISMLVLLFLFSIYVTITQEKLREMAHFDKLTKLPNRAYFYIELSHEIKRANRAKEKMGVMFIDLDGFKAVNDTYGHNVGDELLVMVANRLDSGTRNIDIVGRIGGDEFVIMLSNIHSREDITLLAQKLIDSLNKDFIINKNAIRIGASIGISVFPEDAQDLESLINNADNAMYMAKNSGKNRAIQYIDIKDQHDV